MGIAERKQREKLQMRSAIIDAAKEMFIEQGFEKTSIRKIAKKIEYSPGTIYLYFKNKNELFYEVHEQAFAKFLHGLKEASESAGNTMDRMRAMGLYYINFAQQNPELYDLMFIMEAPMQELPDDDWNCGFQSYDLLKAMVQQCLDEGIFPSGNVDVMAYTIFSFMHGMVSLKVKHRMDDKIPIEVRMMAMENLLQMMMK